MAIDGIERTNEWMGGSELIWLETELRRELLAEVGNQARKLLLAQAGVNRLLIPDDVFDLLRAGEDLLRMIGPLVFMRCVDGISGRSPRLRRRLQPKLLRELRILIIDPVDAALGIRPSQPVALHKLIHGWIDLLESGFELLPHVIGKSERLSSVCGSDLETSHRLIPSRGKLRVQEWFRGIQTQAFGRASKRFVRKLIEQSSRLIEA